MQRYVKEKSIAYGIAGILLAIVLTGICYQFGILPSVQPMSLELKTFSSYDELKFFLKTSMEQAKPFGYRFAPFLTDGESNLLSPSVKGAIAHSTTNIQVAGVDEADIVKTDGEYLYVVSNGNVYILKAYPPEEARVLSKIVLNETYSIEIYVNGDRLAILGNNYPFYYPSPAFIDSIIYTYSEEAFIKVYDISDRVNPVLKRDVILNGTLSSSRMIGDYVYGVVNQPAIDQSSYETDIVVTLPKICTGDVVEEVQPTDIHYVSIPDVFYYFTTVVAVNITNDAQEITYEPFLTGSTTCIYVSLSNMYLAVPNTGVWFSVEMMEETREETLIYRVKLDEENINLEAEGSVFGYVLNQFSMDEYNGFFRIATTEWMGESKNSLFILDMNLNIVGKLEGIAPGERIYSARFMGDRCYLVTFRQVDPFFVIDIGNPTEPKILGELKIPGFSGYMHPYDENHIIGIGKQDSNVKISLFDVTNVSAPTEAVPPYIVQGDWSDTTVLTDHKAFLFDNSRQLLALPVSIYWYGVEGDEYSYTNSFWQGAYIFNINLIDGFVHKGNVTHQEESTYEWDSGYWVKRILYIDNLLYTISDKKIKINNFEDLALIEEIELL